MGEFALQLKSQSIEFWQKLSKNQKIIIITSAVAIILALLIFARGAAQPDYRPLFGEALEPGQANLIIDKLKELKIPYQLSEGGDSIQVPAKNLAETRLAVAGDPTLPMGGVVGFEAFDKPGFGETETDRQAKYLRALQGELTRTIEQMDEVIKARVHIVMPKDSLFSGAENASTAAVVLKLAPARSLAENQVRGLIKLVASSVEGLDSKNVTIVDTRSNILSEAFEESIDGVNNRNRLTATQLELQQQVQKDVQQSVQSMLERVMGPGKAVVRVNAQLDFDDTKVHKESLGKPVVVSKHSLEEISSGENNPSGGVTGIQSNVPGTPQYPASEGGKTAYEKIETTTNNEFDSKEQEEIIKAQGKVEKLSVAVVLDGEFTPSEQTKIQGLVVSAAGLDEKRGDQVSVVGMPFDTSTMKEISTAMAADQKREQQLIYGIITVLLLLSGGAIIFFLQRRYKENQTESDLVLGHTITVEEMLAAHTEQEVAQDPAALEKAERQNQVQKVAKEKPEDVARLLKTWLTEE